MDIEASLNHEQLLTLARKVQAAARDRDTDRLSRANFRLFAALVDHLGGEAAALVHLPPGEARLLRRGQERVVDAVVDVALSSQTSGRSCRCAELADALVAQLSLQTDDERIHLGAAGIAA